MTRVKYTNLLLSACILLSSNCALAEQADKIGTVKVPRPAASPRKVVSSTSRKTAAPKPAAPKAVPSDKGMPREEAFMRRSSKQEKEDAQKALNEALEQLKTDPESAAAYDQKAEAEVVLEQYADAITDATQAIKLDPDFAKAYATRSQAYYMQKKYQQALADLNKAIQLKPDFAGAYIMRGNVYQRLENYALAKQDHDKGMSLQGANADASTFVNRAATNYLMKNYGACIADATRAIALNPNDPVAYDNRGLAYHQLRNFQAAIKDYNKAISLKPNEAKYICHRGISYAEMGQHERAIKDFDEAIRLKPNFALAYFDRGLSHYFRHEYEKSAKDIQEAIHYDHRFALALVQLPIDPTKGAKPELPMTDPDQYFYRATSAILLNRQIHPVIKRNAIADLRKYLDLVGWKGDKAGAAAILLYLGYRIDKETPQATAMLSEIEQKMGTTDWPSPVVRYFKHEISEQDLITAAADDRDLLTDAHAYIGIDQLLNGKRKEGLDHINWIMGKGSGQRISFSLAVREREKLQIRKSRQTEKV